MAATTQNRIEHIAALVVWVTLLAGCAGTGQDHSVEDAGARRLPVIDMHVHALRWDHFGNPPPPNPETGLQPAARTDKEAMEASLAEMKRYNIVRAVVSGPLETVRL